MIVCLAFLSSRPVCYAYNGLTIAAGINLTPIQAIGMFLIIRQ